MRVFRKILSAALALGMVAVEAASAQASAAANATTMSIGPTLTAALDASARRVGSEPKVGALVKGVNDGGSIAQWLAENSRIAKSTGIKPELTTHWIADAHSDTIVTTLSY